MRRRHRFPRYSHRRRTVHLVDLHEVATPETDMHEHDDDPEEFKPRPADSPPRCARCGRIMIERKGRFGAFWGCPNYPTCRYTVNITNKPQSTSTGAGTGTGTSVDPEDPVVFGAGGNSPSSSVTSLVEGMDTLELRKELAVALAQNDKLKQTIRLRNKELDEANRQILMLEKGKGEIVKAGHKSKKKIIKKRK